MALFVDCSRPSSRLRSDQLGDVGVGEPHQFTQHHLLDEQELEAIGDFFGQQPGPPKPPLKPVRQTEPPGRVLIAKRRRQISDAAVLPRAVEHAR